MKKLNFLFAVIIILTLIFSCEKGGRISEEQRDDVPYTGGADFVFIGGNVECGDEGVILPGLVPVAPYTSGRLNYLGDGKFDNEWTPGLVVTVRPDNKTVDFSLTDEAQFCVGAVIVKGGNGAMVYKYPFGTRGDIGLTSPLNSSFDPADLSNLTFCFVKCKEIAIAVKAFYWPGPEYVTYSKLKYSYCLSTGDYIYCTPENCTTDWCKILGVNTYPIVSSFSLQDGYYKEDVGSVTIVSGPESLIITVTLKEGGILDKTYLYAGPIDGLIGTTCPIYSSLPWQTDNRNLNSVSFTVPY